jgi:predicted O-methyltransferase YrrM
MKAVYRLARNIPISILRRIGINLDKGHTWERIAHQYHDGATNKSLYEFIRRLIPHYLSTENTLLLQRIKSVDQKKIATNMLGDHYRLLKSIALSIGARSVVDIGTYTGMSAISFLDAGCNVKSFDIVQSLDFKDNVITNEDLGKDKIELICGNLYDDHFFSKNIEVLINADIIFLDGPKFGGFEQKVLRKILDLDFHKDTIIVMDDIHMKKMKILWYELDYPRLDLTLFGHISGTGVIFPKYGKLNVSSNNYK